MVLHILGVAALLTACGARPTARQAARPGPAWHVVLHEIPAYGHYLVNISLVPPDGSRAVQLPEIASRAPCLVGSENRFCVRNAGALPEYEWGVSCGETRMHVLLDPHADRLTIGRSNDATEFCAITTARQTLSARGAVAVVAIPWVLADGGMHPSP